MSALTTPGCRTPGCRTPDRPTPGYPTIGQLTHRAHTLAAERPDLVRLRAVGSSRSGRPLWLLSLGHGTHDILSIAGAHANEPIGGASCLRLMDHLTGSTEGRDTLRELDAAWHLLLALDPDGISLSERWLSQPPSLLRYFQGFYRPHSSRQPEFLPQEGSTAPLTPESETLLGLLAELRPVLQFSLHGNELGGGFVQFTDPLPGGPAVFRDTAAELRVPLEFRPYDGVDWIADSPGVLTLPPDSGTTERDSTGFLSQATWMYAMRYGTSSVVVEAPIWGAAGVTDPGPVADPEREIAAVRELLLERAEQVEKALDGHQLDTREETAPIAAAAREILDVCPTLAETWRELAAPPDGSPLVVGTSAGNCASLAVTARRTPLRAAAMARRALDPEDTIRADALNGLLRAWCAELEAGFAPYWVPVDDQAALHVRTMLGIARLRLT
jgi:hypothetical protein